MNGILVVNKKSGYTSRDVVNIISQKFHTRKVGHTGTLDPIAEGVLVIALGRALKIVDLLTSTHKEYVAGVVLGFETDMLDITGKETKRNLPNVTEDDIRKVLKSFLGKQNQEVPMYSAVKVKGKKLYEYARNGEEVTPPVKKIEIFHLELEGPVIFHQNEVEFTIRCFVSKGTYIRSLIRDIGYKLGTYGTMKSLTRTRQGSFTLDDAYTIEDIQKDHYKLLSIRDALPNIKVTVIDNNLLPKVKNGMVLDSFFEDELSLLVDKEGKEIAIYQKTTDGKVKPYKMIEV